MLWVSKGTYKVPKVDLVPTKNNYVPTKNNYVPKRNVKTEPKKYFNRKPQNKMYHRYAYTWSHGTPTTHKNKFSVNTFYISYS